MQHAARTPAVDLKDDRKFFFVCSSVATALLPFRRGKRAPRECRACCCARRRVGARLLHLWRGNPIAVTRLPCMTVHHVDFLAWSFFFGFRPFDLFFFLLRMQTSALQKHARGADRAACVWRSDNTVGDLLAMLQVFTLCSAGRAMHIRRLVGVVSRWVDRQAAADFALFSRSVSGVVPIRHCSRAIRGRPSGLNVLCATLSDASVLFFQSVRVHHLNVAHNIWPHLI